MLSLQGPGTTVSVPVATHRAASALIFAEASRRIPAKVESLDGTALGKPEADAGEKLTRAPQVAGQHCKQSDKLIAFEKDGRLCGRCGRSITRTASPSAASPATPSSSADQKAIKATQGLEPRV